MSGILRKCLGSTVCLPSGFKDIRCQYFIYTSRHSKDIECYNFSSCISKGISYPMIFASRHIRSPALSKAPIGLSMRTGTGQILPVGTVFRCTEGNRWDIRQLVEPAGWFYRTTNSYDSWIVGLILDKYCIGIRVSNEVYKQGSKYCRGRYWEPAPSIPGIFRSTNEYRHDILQQPEPAGWYNRTTNNCECIDCSILVFLDCFLSVI